MAGQCLKTMLGDYGQCIMTNLGGYGQCFKIMLRCYNSVSKQCYGDGQYLRTMLGAMGSVSR